MEDGQFAGLLSALGAGLAAIAATIKWAVSRMVKAYDDSSRAMIENTVSNAKLHERLGHLLGRLETTIERVNSIGEFVEEVTSPEVPVYKPIKAKTGRTPAGGVATGYYSHVKKRGDDE